ncbi:hypothetical protein BTA51_05610 [Hahella sp. CCB-MM4]|nr:hypothetical protein BTA51_05610 [Hahella sp. CCB-MM4]
MFGCASPARVDQMVASGHLNYDKNLQHSIELTDVKGGESTNPLWTSEIGNPEFTSALRQSLHQQNLLGSEDQTKYELTANLISVDQPLLGLDMEVITLVEYSLTEKATGKSIFKQSIQAPYTATVGDSFIAIERLRLANEGSARENISQLLNKLAELKIDSNQVALVQ